MSDDWRWGAGGRVDGGKRFRNTSQAHLARPLAATDKHPTDGALQVVLLLAAHTQRNCVARVVVELARLQARHKTELVESHEGAARIGREHHAATHQRHSKLGDESRRRKGNSNALTSTS